MAWRGHLPFSNEVSQTGTDADAAAAMSNAPPAAMSPFEGRKWRAEKPLFNLEKQQLAKPSGQRTFHKDQD